MLRSGGSVTDVELAEDVGEMRFDGMLGDTELFGYLGVAFASGDQSQDFVLASGQRFEDDHVDVSLSRDSGIPLPRGLGQTNLYRRQM